MRRIGIVWAGNPNHPNDARRSMPDDMGRRLVEAVPTVRWVSLMHTHRAEAVAALRDEGRLEVPPTPANVGELAQQIAGLDGVVGVDTGPLHLAGTLGVPALWLIAAAHDWRWLTHTLAPEVNIWYPTGRLVRQAAGEGWEPVVDRAAALVRERWG